MQPDPLAKFVGRSDSRRIHLIVFPDHLEIRIPGFLRAEISSIIQFGQVVQVAQRRSIFGAGIVIESSGGGKIVITGLSRSQSDTAYRILNAQIAAFVSRRLYESHSAGSPLHSLPLPPPTQSSSAMPSPPQRLRGLQSLIHVAIGMAALIFLFIGLIILAVVMDMRSVPSQQVSAVPEQQRIPPSGSPSGPTTRFAVAPAKSATQRANEPSPTKGAPIPVATAALTRAYTLGPSGPKDEDQSWIIGCDLEITNRTAKPIPVYAVIHGWSQRQLPPGGYFCPGLSFKSLWLSNMANGQVPNMEPNYIAAHWNDVPEDFRGYKLSLGAGEVKKIDAGFGVSSEIQDQLRNHELLDPPLYGELRVWLFSADGQILSAKNYSGEAIMPR